MPIKTKLVLIINYSKGKKNVRAPIASYVTALTQLFKSVGIQIGETERVSRFTFLMNDGNRSCVPVDFPASERGRARGIPSELFNTLFFTLLGRNSAGAT